MQAAAAQPLNMSEVAAIPGVTPGSYTPTTLSFGWSNSTPGNFPSQSAAKSAYFDVLSQVDPCSWFKSPRALSATNKTRSGRPSMTQAVTT